MKHIYIVNGAIAHTALSTILELFPALTYRAAYNHDWSKPLDLDGLRIKRLPVVKPKRVDKKPRKSRKLAAPT